MSFLSLPSPKGKSSAPLITSRSLSDDEDYLSSPDIESTFEKRGPSKSRRIKKCLSAAAPIVGLFVAAVLIFIMGYHVGRSNAIYDLQTSLIPTINNETEVQSGNLTDIAEPQPVSEEDEYEDEDEDRPLITYAYYETDNARENALFFINHGLHAQADFIFILNGDTDLADHIPGAPNIQIIHRNNTCFDLGAHMEVLTANNNTLMNRYNRFIMLNASIRGPFLPIWSNECWSDAYLDQLSDTNKLVGMVLRCTGDGYKRKVIQSMIYATDRKGLEIMMPVLNHCFATFWKAVHAEEHAAQAVLDAGYNVTVLMSAFQSDPDYVHTCRNGEILREGGYFGTNIHPYETIFQKANRNIFPRQLDLLTKWHNQAGYSSWNACWKKRMMQKRARMGLKNLKGWKDPMSTRDKFPSPMKLY